MITKKRLKKLLSVILNTIYSDMYTLERLDLIEQITLRYCLRFKLVKLIDDQFKLTHKGEKFIGD